jgi:hypothetical protein
MTIIASDGSPIAPFETEIVVIYGGERFDIVLNANQNIGNYWIRTKGLAGCKKVKSFDCKFCLVIFVIFACVYCTIIYRHHTVVMYSRFKNLQNGYRI